MIQGFRLKRICSYCTRVIGLLAVLTLVVVVAQQFASMDSPVYQSFFFDSAILRYINGLAGRSWTMDYLIVWLNGDGFQKGGIIMMLFWYAWFMRGNNSNTRRETLICTLAAAPLALVLSRFISFLAPFRIRPLHVPDLHIRLAYTLRPETLINWNSFPSDHAVLFFTLVTGLFFVSRRLALIAFSYVVLLICLPRIYLGIHYPTDIFAGIVLGVGVSYVVCLPRVRSVLGQPVLNWIDRFPALSGAFFFFYTCQISNAFGWVRDVILVAFQITANLIEKLPH